MSTPAQSRAELLLSAEKRMLEAIANRVSLLEVLDDLCRTIDAHSPGVISSVALMDADGKRLWLGAGPRFPTELRPVAFPWPIGPGRGACGTAAFLKQRVIISDITIDPRWPDDCRDLPVSHGLRAAWSEPLISKDGAVLGTFAMYYGEPRIPDTSDLELIEAAGHIARIAIEMERSQVALRESEERLRLAAQTGRMFAFSWDAATDVIERSGESAEILGVAQGAVTTGAAVFAMVYPADKELLEAVMAKLTAESPCLQVTHRMIRPDGAIIWLERNIRAYFDERGKVKRIIGMVLDVTERKRAEVALLRHAAIVESSDDAIIGTNLSGTVTDWNKGAERLFGYLASEAIGKSISFLRAPDRSEEGHANLKKVMNGDVVKPYETVLQRKDGTLVDVSLRISPIVDSEGRIVGASGISHDITERKQSEKALRESEERFRGLYENATLGLYRTTPDGKILLANPSLVKMLGFSSFSELAQRNLEEKGFEPGYERAEFKHRLATEGEVKGLEASWTRRDGTAICVRESAKAIRDAEDKIAYYEGTVEDITERKRAEEALRQSEEKFLKAFRGSPVAITLSRVRDHRFIEVNDTFERLTGYRREEVIGSTASDIGLWVDPSQREELTKRLLSERSLRDLELRFRVKNGSVLTCLIAAELIEVGNEPCILSVASDITQRKLTEDRLREYEKAVEGLEEMIVVVDRQYRYLIANRKFLNLRNMTKEQVEGRFANEVLNNGVFETVVKEKLDECFRGNVVRFGMKYTYPELGERDISVSYFPIEGATGVDRAACIFQDVTERKQMEEALKKSEEKFSKAFRESPLVVAITRMQDHRYLDVSESFEQWIGWRREEVIGRTPFDIGIWVDPAERSEFVKRLQADGVVRNLEFRYRRKDGVEMVGLGSGELIEIGNEQCVISVITDITDRKQAEEALSGMTRKLVEAQEQERARIARELHDDINQRIALLAIELDQLREKHKDLPFKVRGHVQKLQRITADVASRVYALSHELYSSIPDSLGLAKGMRSWCREFGKRQKMEIDFKSHDLPRLPQEISLCLFRVLQEALHNSAKHSGVERIEVQIGENSGEIHLIVSDSGKGFDIDAARRRGGLGLLSMQERVRLVGGTIVINSKPLGGTTLRVCVPFRAERTE